MNKNKINFKNISRSRWFIFLTTGFFIFTTIFLIFTFAFEFYYKGKIYPRIEINGVNLSGETREDGLRKLKMVTEKITNEGLFFQYKEKEVVVAPVIVSANDPGLSKEIISLNLENIIDDAYLLGRHGPSFFNFKEKFLILLSGKEIKPYYLLNKEELMDILLSNFSSLENPGRDAGIDIKVKWGKFKVEAIEEKLGKSFDYDLAIENAENNIKTFSSKPIEMYMKTDYPLIKVEKIKQAVPMVESILSQAPINLVNKCLMDPPSGGLPKTPCYDLTGKKVDNNDFARWITLDKDNGGVKVVIERGEIINYLEKLSEKINIPAQDARLEIEEGRVIEFQESKDGIKVNIEKTIFDIEDKILNKSSSTAQLIIEKDVAKNSMGDVNDLGIKELIGIGKSDFSGSPKNRRHNIGIGASTLHGLIINPDEGFSLVGELGEVNADTGYLEELVIKGNRTVPEFGGGLCQIATTVFRSALNSGLSITERRSHAYRVSYYEPAGMDATIYIPRPDLRFINDTGNHILIQTKIEGDDLIFEFWGTSDGRSVELSEPKIFNIVEPGPTKIIETEDLEPGEKNCTESSHNGADAEFTRKITKANGEIEEELWKSKYRPWQAVCLVGKEEGENPSSDIEEIKDSSN